MKIRRPKLKIYSLRKSYGNDFECFTNYDITFNISGRLGYKNAETAWKANPNYTIDLTNNKLTKVKKTKFYKLGQQAAKRLQGNKNK